jgi:phosphoenolpyruvate carboxykinase (ATP)
MLAQRKLEHASRTWLVNTGWTGGGYGAGTRISLSHTRAIIDAIHSGELNHAATDVDPIFGLAVPRAVSGVPSEILVPERAWADPAAYRRAAYKLAELFSKNFQQYAADASDATCAAGPKLPQVASV